MNQSTICARFSVAQLRSATRDFSPSLLVGGGTYGQVFKGELNGTQVAVKRLVGVDALDSGLAAELQVLGRVRHPNIVLLMGHCPEEACLVYEYLEEGSLQSVLNDFRRRASYGWESRIRTGLELATAMLFLHRTDPPVVHGDLKPANILLDDSWHCKVADAGLARFGSNEIHTPFEGSTGYADPSCVIHSSFSAHSDVYAFGVILLQLLTGQSDAQALHKMLCKCAERIAAQQPLVGFGSSAHSLSQPGSSLRTRLEVLQGGHEQLLAAEVLQYLDCNAGAWPYAVSLKLANEAVKCLRPNPSERPTMAQLQTTMRSATEEGMRSSSRGGITVPASARPFQV